MSKEERISKVNDPQKPDLVSFEDFNEVFMGYQEDMRKELRKGIMKIADGATGLYKHGLVVAADYVWKEVKDEVAKEIIVDGRG
jgi:hypothetical protein